MSSPSIPIRDIAIALARQNKLPLEEAQRQVVAAAQRLSANAPAQGSGEWLRQQQFKRPPAPPRQSPTPTARQLAAAPSVRELALAYAREHKLPLEAAQCEVYSAVRRSSGEVPQGASADANLAINGSGAVEMI